MLRRKKNKGFTLIELLVVVAIIGILASVGVVAYSGYTTSAKKGAVKSNHNSVKKWIQNELQKCNIGESKAMNDALTCSKRTNKTIVTAVVKSLSTDSDDMMNPWDGDSDAVVAGTLSSCSSTNEGQTAVVADGSKNIKITSCTASGETVLTLTVPM